MTVGIYLTNNESLEAVVLSDAQMNSEKRKTNSFKKSEAFFHEFYHGVIYGAGIASELRNILLRAKTKQARSLEKFAEGLYKTYMEHTLNEKEKCNMYIPQEIMTKVLYLIPENFLKLLKKRGEHFKEHPERITKNFSELEEFYKEKLQEEIDKWENENEALNETSFLEFSIIGYDKKEGIIKAWIIGPHMLRENVLLYDSVGNGSDGATFYFNLYLEGIENKQMQKEELLFHIFNAYHFATLNTGVGGIPSVYYINKEGVIRLSPEETITLTNLSAAYIARYNETFLTTATTQRLIKDLFTEKEKAYKDMQEILQVTQTTLTRRIIPVSSWIESKNYERPNT